ncbi:hypothetical protein [Psychrobacillus psychrotolerans]|uniref:hypothetical protein n=1 Tax=Psychrobacillus psychrotolerans TaxID=126156 RepID=UPI00331528D3
MNSYEVKAICDELQIADSTLRKYATIFEKVGYIFARDSYGRRIYNQKDLQTFKRFKKEKKKNSKIDNQTIALRILDIRYQDLEHIPDNGVEFPFYYFEKQYQDLIQILHQLQNSVFELTKKNEEIEKNQAEQSALFQIVLAEKKDSIIDKLRRKR